MVVVDVSEIGPKTSARQGKAAIEERLRLIVEIADDDERAHSAQDDLLAEVLGAIGRGYRWPKTLALHASKVFEIQFSRWYA
jgi:hypothetical protein